MLSCHCVRGLPRIAWHSAAWSSGCWQVASASCRVQRVSGWQAILKASFHFVSAARYSQGLKFACCMRFETLSLILRIVSGQGSPSRRLHPTILRSILRCVTPMWCISACVRVRRARPIKARGVIVAGKSWHEAALECRGLPRSHRQEATHAIASNAARA